MALREIRASWQRLLFFFVCIAIGVGSIVALRSVIQNVRAALARETRTLIASDILLTSNSPLAAGSARRSSRASSGRAACRQTTDAVEIATMVRPADGRPAARMVELRAVQAGVSVLRHARRCATAPIRTIGSRRAARSCGPSCWLSSICAVGDRILIGAQPFEIRGVIAAEPGRSLGAFSLGPRVLVDYADLQATGLLSFGSRAQLPAAAARARGDRARGRHRRSPMRLRTSSCASRGYWQNADRIGEDLTRAENYLSLVGLVILILGGIGVSSVTRVFVQQKVRSIAILKCLGGTSAACSPST